MQFMQTQDILLFVKRDYPPSVILSSHLLLLAILYIASLLVYTSCDYRATAEWGLISLNLTPGKSTAGVSLSQALDHPFHG